MSNIKLEKVASSLQVGQKLKSYTGVIIHAGKDNDGNEITYSAGTNYGYVLETENPIGTQEMADGILASLSLRNIRYQPFNASKTIIDPAIEIGDAVSIEGTESAIFSYGVSHSNLMAADVAAPFDEEIDHEFQYVPRTTREFKRESTYARSRISQTQEEITFEVARATDAEGTLSTQISQRLDNITLSVSSSAGSSVFTLRDGTTTLDTQTLDLSVKAVNVSGTLTASQIAAGAITSDKISVSSLQDISNGVAGFTLTNNEIYKKVTGSYYLSLYAPASPSSSTSGIYMATWDSETSKWIPKFTVTYGGRLRAVDAELEGTVRATAGVIGGVTISDGTLSGITDTNIAVGGISGGSGGSIGSGTVSTYNTVSGINTNLGYAAGYGAAIVNGTSSYPAYFSTGTLRALTQILCPGSFYFGGYGVTRKALGFYDGEGNYQTVNYLAWA